MGNLVFEEYNNIYKFMNTINTRSNNGKFGLSSKDKGSDWNGNFSWEEAVKSFENGISEVANELKNELKKFSISTPINSRKVRNYYHGYTPNVPNAIIGLPKSMRQINRVKVPAKTINILYNCTQNAGTSGDTLKKSGKCVLQLINYLERSGVRVKLTISVFSAVYNDERAYCFINLKDYRQPLDVLKLSFPLTSPAMFRRFGFRWAETVPGIIKEGWRYGYGRSEDREEFLETFAKLPNKKEKMLFLTVTECKALNFDPLKIADNYNLL